MSTVLLLSSAADAAESLPSLTLLAHQLRVAPAEASSLLDHQQVDLLVVDARHNLPAARALCRLITSTGKEAPLLIIVTEGGLTALSSEWGFDDLILASAGPAEVDARIRILAAQAQAESHVISSSGVTIDEAGYSARLNGRPLDLTYTEFELLKFLVQHPDRVFSREQLLSDVWGYDYYGGTRTVDVHIRRLRAKLGPEHEAIIGTVRNVGYRLVSRR